MRQASPANRRVLALGLALALLATASLTARAEDAKYAGSKKSDVYHYVSCRHVKRVKPVNLRYFATVGDAKRAGYRACKVCHPPLRD